MLTPDDLIPSAVCIWTDATWFNLKMYFAVFYLHSSSLQNVELHLVMCKLHVMHFLQMNVFLVKCTGTIHITGLIRLKDKFWTCQLKSVFVYRKTKLTRDGLFDCGLRKILFIYIYILLQQNKYTCLHWPFDF